MECFLFFFKALLRQRDCLPTVVQKKGAKYRKIETELTTRGSIRETVKET